MTTNTMTSAADTLSTLESAIELKLSILDTYEGMASLYDGEGAYPAHVFDRIDDLKLEIAALAALYNSVLVAMEPA